MLKEGDALERLAEADIAVFDKTGTLTMPEPDILNPEALPIERRAEIGALAAASTHPLAQALARALCGTPARADVREERGHGLSAGESDDEQRLGSLTFCDAEAEAVAVKAQHPDASLIAYRHGEEDFGE